MAKNREKSLEKTPDKASEGEKAKIGIVESTIVTTISGFADAAEVLGALFFPIPYVGFVVWLLTVSFGAFISAILFLWAMFRGMGITRRMAQLALRRILILAAGYGLDLATGGALPLRTI